MGGKERDFLRLEDVWRWVVLLNVSLLSNKYGWGPHFAPMWLAHGEWIDL